MTANELQQFGWMLMITVSALSISWVVLFLQAIFHDKRIALVGMAGLVIGGISLAFSKTLGHILLSVSVVVSLVFVIWFLLKNFRSPVVYICAPIFILSLMAGIWLYMSIPK